MHSLSEILVRRMIKFAWTGFYYYLCRRKELQKWWNGRHEGLKIL